MGDGVCRPCHQRLGPAAFRNDQRRVKWLVDQADLQVADGTAGSIHDMVVGHETQRDALWARFRGRCHGPSSIQYALQKEQRRNMRRRRAVAPRRRWIISRKQQGQSKLPVVVLELNCPSPSVIIASFGGRPVCRDGPLLILGDPVAFLASLGTGGEGHVNTHHSAAQGILEVHGANHPAVVFGRC